MVTRPIELDLLVFNTSGNYIPSGGTKRKEKWRSPDHLQNARAILSNCLYATGFVRGGVKTGRGEAL
jgi:hypothetical protein